MNVVQRRNVLKIILAIAIMSEAFQIIEGRVQLGQILQNYIRLKESYRLSRSVEGSKPHVLTVGEESTQTDSSDTSSVQGTVFHSLPTTAPQVRKQDTAKLVLEICLLVGSAIALCVIIAIISLCVYRRSKKQKETEKEEKVYPNNIFINSLLPFKGQPKNTIDTEGTLNSMPDNLAVRMNKNFKNLYIEIDEDPKSPFSDLQLQIEGLQKFNDTTYQGCENPFINQFCGEVSSEGGVISSPSSDVQVVVPPGAIPENLGCQKIYVNVAPSADKFNINYAENEMSITYMVECLAPGLDRFLKPVIVRIPHRAYIPGSDWVFRAQYSNSAVSSSMTWHDIPQEEKENNIKQDIHFTYDEDYVNIATHHFTTFTCSACGKTRPLKLHAVAFGNQLQFDGQLEVHVRVFISDGFADAHKLLCAMEHNYGGICLSQYKQLTVVNRKDWEISLSNVQDDSWPWKLKQSSNFPVQVIHMDHCYTHCGGTYPSTDYVLIPKDMDNKPADLGLTFTVAQRRKDRSRMDYTTLITHKYTIEDSSSKARGYFLGKSLTNEQREYITEHLPHRHLGVLTRNLGLSDTDLEIIRHDFVSSLREQKYQVLLLWQRREGEMATLGKFCKACEKAGLKNITDDLHEMFGDYKPVLEIAQI